MNSKLPDDLRWMAPVQGRLSKLQNKKFTPWKEKDPHPCTDNSYKSYQKIGQMFFGKTEVKPIGSLERFNRILPRGKLNLKFRRFPFKAERLLPKKLNLLMPAAR